MLGRGRPSAENAPGRWRPACQKLGVPPLNFAVRRCHTFSLEFCLRIVKGVLSFPWPFMAVSLKALGIDRLGVEERLALVEELWDSIASDSAAIPLTSEQSQELERRLADYEANPNEGVPWSEVKASINKLLGK